MHHVPFPVKGSSLFSVNDDCESFLMALLAIYITFIIIIIILPM